MQIEILSNISEFIDNRGIVTTYIPNKPLVEINIITTKKGVIRGFHSHPEYEEYMIITSGMGIITEHHDDGTTKTLETPVGSVVRIPANVKHSSEALTDYTFINLLTKRWADCMNPIVPMSNK